MSVTAIVGGSVRGALHQPDGEAAGGVVITHGAGGNFEMPLLVAVAEAFETAGFVVLRYNLPFRQKRPFGAPGSSAAALDQAGLAEAIGWMRTKVSGKVFVGGQSYGGRQSSLLLSEQPGITDALLLLSYPLHPPGKPEVLRTAHFSNIRKPALFVQGTKDPFGSPAELTDAIKLIPAPTRQVIVEGAGHELLRGKFDIKANVVDPLLDLAANPRNRPARP